MKGAGSGARGCVSRVETASLWLVIARHRSVVEVREAALVREHGRCERCDPLARSGRGRDCGPPGSGSRRRVLSGSWSAPVDDTAARDNVARRRVSDGGGEHRDPDLCGSAALCVAGFASQPSGVFEHAEGAFDLKALLVAAEQLGHLGSGETAGAFLGC